MYNNLNRGTNKLIYKKARNIYEPHQQMTTRFLTILSKEMVVGDLCCLLYCYVSVQHKTRLSVVLYSNVCNIIFHTYHSHTKPLLFLWIETLSKTDIFKMQLQVFKYWNLICLINDLLWFFNCFLNIVQFYH